MKKIVTFIVNHRKSIIVFYGVLIVISFILSNFVRVQYDLSSYLPGKLDSVKGKAIMSDNFDVHGTASLLVKGMSLNEIAELKTNIKELASVKDVIWLDAAEDINKPLEMIDKNIADRFVRGEFSLLQIKFTTGDDAKETQTALDKIDKMVTAEHYIGGRAAVCKDIQETTSREMLNYSLVAFLLITIILLLTSNNYFEPLLFFAAIGTAIMLNKGSNLIFSSVSYTTHSVASILQLAVSMDYSIFLLHRYKEEREKHESVKAMTIALTKTISTVSASALTTLFGFLALLSMNYGLGKDMGLVIAKGVLLSLISVLTLLPCLTLAVEKYLAKFTHKPILPQFKFLSKHLYSLRYGAVILALLLAIPVYLAQTKVSYYYSDERTLSEKSSSRIANEKIFQTFGEGKELIVIIPEVEPYSMVETMGLIEKVSGVSSTEGLYSLVDTSIPKEFIPSEVRKNFESDKYEFFTVKLNTALEGVESSEAVNSIRSIVKDKYKEAYVTGEAAVYEDLKEVTGRDFDTVTIISVLLIGLVLVVTFRSIMLPLILLFVIEIAIWINLSIPYFQGTQLNFISFIVLGAIQLGATVDYAILFTSRYKENIQHLSIKESVGKTLRDCGSSILVSALILMAGTLSVSFITTIKSASELTLLIGRGALLSMLLVYILLPSLLVLFHPLIKLTTIKWVEKNR